MTQSESPFYFQFPDSLWPEESLAKNYFTPAYILIVTVYRGDISGEPVHDLCGVFFIFFFFLGGGGLQRVYTYTFPFCSCSFFFLRHTRIHSTHY